MAKLLTTKSYYKWPVIWKDPDATKNRIFIDNHAYDLTTLAPKSAEIFYWQTTNGQWTHSATIDFDDWGPVQFGYVDGNVWGEANSSIWAEPGVFDLWMCSLDLNGGYRPTRIWRSGGGMTIATYPRSGALNDQNGDWWAGRDMTERGQSYRHSDTFFYTHIYEHEESLNFNASSWSYSGTTITVNQTAHGFFTGDTVTVSGATATTNAPNGTFIVSSAAANSFTYVNFATPTGSAGGTMNVQGTTWRGWGVEMERDQGQRVVMITGHNYTRENNSTTAGVSRPTYVIANTGGNKHFLGIDTYGYIWFVRVEKAGTSGFSVFKYLMTGGAATETSVLASTVPAGTLASSVICPMPSNIRAATATRIVFYSSHLSTTDIAPLRLVWDKAASSITANTCSLNFPAGTNFATFCAVPTANNFNAAGYNAYWSKPHQFTVNGVDYITFCFIDKFIWSNTARFPTVKSRTWLTFTLGTGTNDDQLAFHSGFAFLTTQDFPGGFAPFNTAGTKIATFSNNSASIMTFDNRSLDADSWSYSTQGNGAIVTVTKTAHGLSAGNSITVTGSTTDVANPPNGVFRIESVPTSDTFTYFVDTSPSGTPSGTMNVKLGWQVTSSFGIRARGYAIDNTGRIFVTTRTPTLGRNEVHVFSENVPNTISIVLADALTGTTNQYTYSGSTVNSNLIVNAYDSTGARVLATIDLSITGDGMTFSGGQKTTQVTTSASTNTNVAVTLISAGQSSVTASVSV